MEYNIKLAEEFLEEFEEICNYISDKLKSPDISIQLRRRVIYKISLLEKIPRMFAKIKKMSRLNKQYRRIVINNYIILYAIDDNKKTVYIMHIYYGRRNYFDDLS